MNKYRESNEDREARMRLLDAMKWKYHQKVTLKYLKAWNEMMRKKWNKDCSRMQLH